jgi:hypothetical protein
MSVASVLDILCLLSRFGISMRREPAAAEQPSQASDLLVKD